MGTLKSKRGFITKAKDIHVGLFVLWSHYSDEEPYPNVVTEVDAESFTLQSFANLESVHLQFGSLNSYDIKICTLEEVEVYLGGVKSQLKRNIRKVEKVLKSEKENYHCYITETNKMLGFDQFGCRL